MQSALRVEPTSTVSKVVYDFNDAVLGANFVVLIDFERCHAMSFSCSDKNYYCIPYIQFQTFVMAFKKDILQRDKKGIFVRLIRARG